MRGLSGILVVLLWGCGDSSEGEAGDVGTSTGTTAAPSTGSSTTSNADSTSASSTSSTGTPATGDAGSSTSSGPSGSSGSSGSSDGSSGTTGQLDCTLPAPPLAYETFTEVFDLSEDLVFDGNGNMLGKQGDDIIMVDAAEQTSVFATVPGLSYGLRMLQGGDVVIALWVADVVARVSPGGAPVDLATGLSIPNGIFVDLDDRVWLTDPGSSAIDRIETDGTVTPLISGACASGAGGIVYDEDRTLLWYTFYDAGQLRRASIDGLGNAGACEQITTIDGWIHGLVLDQCGNLYIVDHRDSELLRLELDAAGEPVSDPVVLAQLPTLVRSAQFGKGNGFSPSSLYLIGSPGAVYSVDVGIPGAVVPPL